MAKWPGIGRNMGRKRRTEREREPREMEAGGRRGRPALSRAVSSYHRTKHFVSSYPGRINSGPSMVGRRWAVCSPLKRNTRFGQLLNKTTSFRPTTQRRTTFRSTVGRNHRFVQQYNDGVLFFKFLIFFILLSKIVEKKVVFPKKIKKR